MTARAAFDRCGIARQNREQKEVEGRGKGHLRSRIMEAKIRTLQRCLDCINKVIRNANDILCDISQPSVCSEVLLSSQGTAYISGVTEVYRVAKRVEGGIKARGISDEMLQQSLRDIEIAWNNLQAFLSFSPPVLRMLPSESTFDCSGETAMAGSENAQAESCGVCLLSILPGFNGLKHAENLLTYQGGHFHASCANLWLNCVDSNLPALTVSPQTSVDSKPPAVTEPNGTAADSNLLPFTVPPQNRNDPNFKSLPIATSP
uniref:Synergin gamma-like n=1 Tax=Callorhinchus milii TaxID=7868 RepID=A0A4W3HQ46_CALMI